MPKDIVVRLLKTKQREDIKSSQIEKEIISYRNNGSQKTMIDNFNMLLGKIPANLEFYTQ